MPVMNLDKASPTSHGVPLVVRTLEVLANSVTPSSLSQSFSNVLHHCSGNENFDFKTTITTRSEVCIAEALRQITNPPRCAVTVDWYILIQKIENHQAVSETLYSLAPPDTEA